LNSAALALGLLLSASCAAASPRRAIVIGLDGFDWGVIRPLMERGRLPNLARLAVEGSTGTMRVPPPLRSPAIWTSAATGVSPAAHGIDDFFVGDRRVSSADRRVEAVWESASISSRTVAVVGWLATWPAETVRGVIVSDQALNPEVREGRVFPTDALAEFPTWAAWDYLGAQSAERLDRFLPFRWDPGYAARWPEGSPEFRRHDLVKRRLAWAFMRDESHARILEALLRRKPALAMIHLWGADHASHAFWRAAFGDAGEDERRDFGGVIAAYYEYLDELVGRLTRAAGPDAIVLVLSDHGFQAWTPPPGDPHPFLTGNHAPDAVLFLAGPGVRRGARLEAPRIVDVTPTLERLLEIAPPSGQEGRALVEAFVPGFLPAPLPPRAARPRPAASAPAALSPAEAERLRAMGYLQ
jgi:predicted AlkP superfamily phosphohydrolase/phosphomutase